MDMKHRILLFSLLGSLLIPATSAHATIKCWKNKDNVRECGQAVPQEYSQQRIEVINSKGIVIKVRKSWMKYVARKNYKKLRN